ncbi:sensor histidine kinase [Streptomyces spectabilis]|uniref:histidine kinase n=1 Tax=Streptomyces spectabilis TaxID=68270 RepID=A0A5P2XLU2_STRST|nr:histidine kinase [Streptomyces spectabilis]MBB5101759.1 signal transduction histidine kinase [Streptomyces spectabilis]MCI3900939.1 histidine kinase [Streptomyces spectabilis]QEV64514.1 two-component sensor histidine kinase [Streptomyces spectabilis]GGV50012.1 two-component sensor histidine kinase [Streptomyces spectabilis]
MIRLLRPLTRAVTYTRWLHLLVGGLVVLAAATVHGVESAAARDWLVITLLPIPLVAAAALVPAMRRAEGLQARLMLFPGAHAPEARAGDEGDAPGISVAPSASWRDRGRTAVWLVVRLQLGWGLGVASVQLIGYALALLGTTDESPDGDGLLLPRPGPAAWNALLLPLPLISLSVLVVVAGGLAAAAARGLLGPSPTERLAALEERTEQLLERNRIARELHDSIGHALTVAVVQAGAARAAADADFTDRALEAIEETGRDALEDLERVLRVLREDAEPAHRRPTLAAADRLLESARTVGATVDAAVSGPVDDLPGPVSREGYRMLQEALTNVLRHAGPVPVRVRVAVADSLLTIDVRNALPRQAAPTGRGGSGLRGIRERAVLLGGRASTGPADGEWRVHAELPLR